MGRATNNLSLEQQELLACTVEIVPRAPRPQQDLVLGLAHAGIGPADVQKQLKKKRVTLTVERVYELMERLRSGFPRKLSHAGPEKFAYHDLSKI